ncbi:hypothetical protein PAMC26577_14010 [Caballeronia sordidicola]|uniref:Uncharacterized protein n=1 Tax=Caballeronia sordidicola TaxID=196367 RepID=A0A242MUH7_CABSO|nr:hypothetical protein PAMC26577_14010 [Caballeronia sordidicola]
MYSMRSASDCIRIAEWQDLQRTGAAFLLANNGFYIYRAEAAPVGCVNGI